MAKVLIQKEKKEFIAELNKDIVTVKSKLFNINDLSKDFHVSGDIIEKKDLKKSGEIVKSKRGKDFIIFDSTFVDDYKRMKRLPQTIPLKDIGLIIVETGIDKNSRVLDSGTGSGANAMMLSRFVKEVVSYEVREEHYGVAQENLKMLGIKNVKLKLASIYERVKEKNFELVTLDLPEPWKALDNCVSVLNLGCFIVSYSTTVPQLMDFVQAVEKNEKVQHVKTIEVQERLWDVKGRKVKPKTTSIGHSGFLTFVRKVLK